MKLHLRDRLSSLRTGVLCPSDGPSRDDELADLRDQVVELTIENQRLRDRLAGKPAV